MLLVASPEVLPEPEASFLRDVEYPCYHPGCSEAPTHRATLAESSKPGDDLFFPRFCQKHADELESNQLRRNKEALRG